MTEKQVIRYLDLVDRRLFIVMHSGSDRKPDRFLNMKRARKPWISGLFRELASRLELPTSSLPMRCATTCATPALSRLPAAT